MFACNQLLNTASKAVIASIARLNPQKLRFIPNHSLGRSIGLRRDQGGV